MYKVGDRVVRPEEPHYKGTLLSPKNNAGTWYVKEDDCEDRSWWNEKYFILEEIYNSPLYQAMKEEE